MTDVSGKRGIWASLHGNPLTLAAAVGVLFMALACAGAPLLCRDDPQLLREWLGALPPGAGHPDCVDRNELTVGSPVVWCHVPSGTGQLVVRVNESSSESFRLIIRRGHLEIRDAHAERLETLDLDPKTSTIRIPGEPRQAASPHVHLTWGMAPPEGVFPYGAFAVEAVMRTKTADARYVADLDDHAVVRTIVRDDQHLDAPVAFRGEDVLEVSSLTRGGVAHPLTVRHWLGTNRSGRDMFASVLYGGRISMMVGAVATLVSLVIGVLYGAIAGYCGGRTDRLMMAGVDVLYAVPFMFLVILLLVHVGRNVIVLFIALGAVQWLTMARIVRGQVLSLMTREFVLAARASGVPAGRIILRHLVPNTAGLVVVYAALTVPAVILEESFLAFIGLTVQYRQQNLDSWGALVKYGVDTLDYHTGNGWWLLAFPSATMVITLLALNWVGEGLRDAIDPQTHQRR